MLKNIKKLKFFIIAIVVAVLVGNILLGLFWSSRGGSVFDGQKKKVEVTQVPASDYFSYQGMSGKDALTLFKEKASVEQDSSGLVISINSRKAASDKREYWAFYINGKMAEVGPADYKMKEGDKIEWKIEKY